MNYLRVKNWEMYQHYKDRNPPWIKYHQRLLTDYEFSNLPDVSKAHLSMIWLLASQLENRIPNDPAWIAKRINATEPVDLPLLIQSGFLEPVNADGSVMYQDASNPLAVARSREAETEAETEAEAEEGVEHANEAKGQAGSTDGVGDPACYIDIAFPMGKKQPDFRLTQKRFQELQELYDFDVYACLKKLRAYLLQNKQKRSGTIRGVNQRIGNWLNREQDMISHRARAPTASRREQNLRAAHEFLSDSEGAIDTEVFR